MATGKAKKVIVPQADEALMPVSIDDVQDKIIVLHGEPVILDRDVAELYGVQTKEINQAVKNNIRKFPEGYILSVQEEEKKELVKNFDRFNILNWKRYGYRRDRDRTGTEFCGSEIKTHHQAEKEVNMVCANFAHTNQGWE